MPRQTKMIKKSKKTPTLDIQPQDVLYSRTKQAIGHPGNIQFRRLIRNYNAAYQSTNIRDEKSAIIRTILAKIAESGGRFLKNDGDCWHEASSDQAYIKVSHALRSSKATPLSKSVQLDQVRSTPQTPMMEEPQPQTKRPGILLKSIEPVPKNESNRWSISSSVLEDFMRACAPEPQQELSNPPRSVSLTSEELDELYTAPCISISDASDIFANEELPQLFTPEIFMR